MADSRYNTLLIIEGECCEKSFFEKLSKLIASDKNTTIISFANDIYELYKHIKELDYETTTKDIILQYTQIDDETRDKIKNTKFVYTYLIFDLDLQNDPETEQLNNLNKVKEMINTFNDETGDFGKLFVNYPMMESYRDFYFSDVKSLKDRTIMASNDLLTNYKSTVGTRGSSKNINSYGMNEFYKICKAHLMKANLLLNGQFTKPSKSVYEKIINIGNIHKKQTALIIDNKPMFILNTSSFLYAEYYPNMLNSNN